MSPLNDGPSADARERADGVPVSGESLPVSRESTPPQPGAGEAGREDEIARLKRVIERDRTAYARIVEALRREVASRRGISESRGPYEWDDEEYQREFTRALDAIVRKLDAMERETHVADWSDSPMTTAEVVRARRGDVHPAPTPAAPARGAEDDAVAARIAGDALLRETGEEADALRAEVATLAARACQRDAWEEIARDLAGRLAALAARAEVTP